MPDEHIHEHATCFNVKDRGLVVISSCGHVGIVNSARQAQEVSGVQKIHALVGGFHLGPAPADYLNQVVTEIKTLESGRDHPDALQRRQFHPGGARADAGQAAGVDDRQPRDLRRMTGPRSDRAVNKTLLAIAFAGGIAVAVGSWWLWPQDAEERSAAALMDAVMWNKEPVGGAFALVDHTGRRRTDADFHGKFLVIYFGFTFCSGRVPHRSAGDRRRQSTSSEPSETRCSRCS